MQGEYLWVLIYALNTLIDNYYTYSCNNVLHSTGGKNKQYFDIIAKFCAFFSQGLIDFLLIKCTFVWRMVVHTVCTLYSGIHGEKKGLRKIDIPAAMYGGGMYIQYVCFVTL